MIESLADLIACLERAVQGGEPNQSLTFDTNLFAQAGELAGLFGSASLQVRQRDAETPLITSDADAVYVVGDAEPFASAPQEYTYAVKVTGTYHGEPILEVLATPAPGTAWTFAGNFAHAFPDYIGYDKPFLTPCPSFIPGVAFEEPSFEATTAGDAEHRLALYADVDLSTGSLEPLGTVLSPGPIPVCGPVEVRPDTFPALDLRGPISGYSVPKLADTVLRIAATGATTESGESLIELVGSTAPGSYSALTVSAPLLQGENSWELTGTPENPDAYSLATGLDALAREVGLPLSLPTGLSSLGGLHMSSIVLGFTPSPSVTGLDLIGLRFASAKNGPVWTAPILGLELRELGIGWDVVDPMTSHPSLLGELTGKLRVDPVDLDVAVSLSGLTTAQAPDVGFVVSIDPESHLTVDRLFERFTGFDPGIDVAITELILQGHTGTRSLQFVAALEPHWELPVPASVDEITFVFNYAPNAYSGQIAAKLTLVGLPWMLRAGYRGAGLGWHFSGLLLPDGQGKSVQDVVRAVNSSWFPDPLPANLGAIELRGLSASFTTLDGAYSFDGVLGWPFDFPTLGLKADIEAELSLTQPGAPPSEPAPPPTGFARGTLKLNDFGFGAVYDFGVKGSETVAFTVSYRQVALTCVVSKNAKGETLLRAHLGGVSFGDIVAYLVELATGDSAFKLPAPWDVLYQLRFDDLWLEVNTTTKAVGALYSPHVDLGIVKVDSIGLTYSKYAGTSSVDLAIVGEFLGTRFGEDNPLKWDLLNDPPPTPPGKGEQLLDLRFLALGQNVVPRASKRFTGVLDVIQTLEKDFAPADGKTNPLPALTALKFSGDGRWLIGADFTVMSAVSIAGVFADPGLYGLRIGLAGPRVKALAGLQFEVLYQKVTNTVGVYHIELTLPTEMRQIQLGAASVTFPVVTVDIYTNGNFHLDFGFPKGGDYSRSFSVQAGYFIGRGGFYLSLLDGATSKRVPVVRNGNFSPVVEFGLGLSVGVGRTLSAGVISGGVTITLDATVEGVLGWFNPNDRSQATDLYYRIQGTAAIVGKAWGKVDFVVVKASFSITAYASVTLTIEAYQAIEVELKLGVEVSASVEILFFTVTFSFATTLDLSFTLGSASTTPWLVAAGDPHARPLQLRSHRPRHLPRAPRPVDVQRRQRAVSGQALEFDWAARRVVGDEPIDIPMVVVPSMTPAIDGASPGAVQIVMALFVATSTPSEARHADEVALVSHATPEEVAFNRLAAGVLRWALGALGMPLAPDGSVTIADLRDIADYLSDRRKRDETFTYPTVAGLIEQNFVLTVSNPIGPQGFYDPGSDSPRDPTDTPPQTAIFPMVPELDMTPDGRETVAFREFALAGQAYRDYLESYYDQLQAGGGSNGASGQSRAATAGEEAVSVTLFCDYFALLAQQAVQQAVEMLDAYPYEASGEETLLDVATEFGGWKVEHRPRPGDTLGTVAAEHGTTIAELRRRNAGLRGLATDESLAVTLSVEVEAGPTVGRIAAANADYPLNEGATLTVTGIRHQVRGEDTLATIAAAFRLDAALLLTEGAATANSTSPELLRAGAQLALPAIAYTVEADDLVVPGEALERIAATFYTRARQRTLTEAQHEQVEWYTAAIGQAVASRADAPGEFRSRIDVPVATLGDDGQIHASGTTTPYVVRPSDTLPGVAAMFALVQLAGPATTHPDAGFAAYLKQVTTTPPSPAPLQPGSNVNIPATKAMLVVAGDTFASLAATFYLGPQDVDPLLDGLVALARANAGADVLAQHAVVALPEVAYPVGKGDTLGSVAQRLDLAVEDLADSAADDAGILVAYATTERRMTVPYVAVREVDDIVGDLTRFGALNTLSTAASRFLLNGMRAPVPSPPAAPVSGALRGLYDVAGQQFPAPVGAAVDYDIRFAKGTTASWVRFEPPPGERANAGPTGFADELTVSLTPSFFEKNAPGVTLDPLTVTGPTPMRLYDLRPAQYVFEQHVPWQPAAGITLPGPTGPAGPSGFSAGGPSLWLFPQTLQQVVAGPTGVTASTAAYELLAQNPLAPGATGAPTRSLERYAWATAIPLRITRAVDAQGAFVPGVYEVTGADQAGRDLLLKAWSYLEVAPAPTDRLYLLRRASAASENSSGLVSDVIDPQATFLLRTNLSTETHSNALLAAGAGTPAGDFYARADSIGAFLREVWEASVTGTGGFHLTYATDGGSALPEELFASDGTASLWAVLLLDNQSRGTTPNRRLYPFNNCAVLAENLDSAATTIHAQLADPAPDDVRAVASVPPGMVGFGLARRHPMGPTATGPTGLTRQLHSLVGYQVQDGADFVESHEGLPLSPVDKPPDWLHLPPGPTAHAYWSYVQGIPIAQFGKVNDTPSSAALPPAMANPYRGITGPGPGRRRDLSKASLAFAYHDVYGNTTGCTEPLPAIDVAVGYTDDVIGLSSWPGSGIDYSFEPAHGGGVRLDVSLTLHAERYLPSEGNAYAHALAAASGDAARYAEVFYQLGQRDLDVALTSNIGTPQPDPGDLKAVCAAFVTKAKVFADTTATLVEREYVTRGGVTLDALATTLGVTPAQLVAANRDVDAKKLFAGLYVKPKIVAAPPTYTLEKLAGMVVGRSGTSPPAPSCAGVVQPDATCGAEGGAGGSTPEAVAADNATQPLTPGLTLRTKLQKSPPLVFDKTLQNRLSAVAAWLDTTVFALAVDPDQPRGAPLEVGLVVDNWQVSGIVADGVVVRIDGVEHVTKDDSFESILGFFNAAPHELGLDRGELAAAVSDLDGLLVAEQTLGYAAMVVPQPQGQPGQPGPPPPTFSLANLPAGGGSVDELAVLNRCAPSFFATGAPLLLGWSCCTVGDGETPASLARNAGVSVDQLAAYNAPTDVGPGVTLTVPGLVYLRDPEACWTAVNPRSEATLASVAAALRTDAASIAAVNRELLGVLRPGAEVVIEGTTLTALATDTLDSLYRRFVEKLSDLTWDQFVAALGAVFRPSGAVVGPLPVVAGSGETAASIDDLAAALGVDAVALVGTNAALEGFLRDGANVTGPDWTPVPVGAYDTMETVLRRLRHQDPAATVADVVTHNGARDDLLTPGRHILVSPGATTSAVPFAPTVPPANAAGEAQMIFPVEVTAAVSRAPGLVHPDFTNSDSVVRSSSGLAPRIGDAAATDLNLEAFAQRFEAAFAAQRLKCAVSGGADKSVASATTRIWAVNFGPGGVSRLAVDAAAPAYYALPPLSTRPLDGELSFPSYVTGQGLGKNVTRRFSGIDLDVWMRQLLATIDLTLTPSYAVPAFRGASGPAGVAQAGPRAGEPGEGPVGLASASAAQVLESSGSAKALLGAPVGAFPATLSAFGATAPSGPVDYERLVGAKEQIAEALRDRVTQVVEAPGPRDAFDLTAAQDVLYQQMLVSLSHAYDGSIVVQLPVDVSSPVLTPRGATGSRPPRAAGNVVPVLHTVAETPTEVTPRAESLAGVALGYRVSAPYLAEAIASVEGILRVGVVIDGHEVGPHDTLGGIAARGGYSPTDWAGWQEFVSRIAHEPVFVDGASFPLSGAARQVFPGDWLGPLAEFFARDAVSVARANQHVIGVVRPGNLKLPGYPNPYAVKATDTLVEVADGVGGKNGTTLGLDDLARLLAAARTPFQAGATLSMVLALPEMSLSTAKLSLGRIGALDGPPPPLSFLLTVKHPEENAKLFLNLDFAISELEYAIRDVPNAGSYQASSWLTLVRPLGAPSDESAFGVATVIPQIQVPIPLRAYPPTPMLTAQSGLASAPDAATVPAMRQWDYRYDFDVTSAAQDADHVKAAFGEPPTMTALGAVSGRLFAALAAFATAYPALQDDLARLPALKPGAQDPVARYAVQALSHLAQSVAYELSSSVATEDEAGGPVDVYAYRMASQSDGSFLQTLTLDPEPPGPIGASAIWPRMYAQSPTAPTAGTGPDAGFLELTPVGTTSGLYQFPQGFAVDEPLTYRARFSTRDVISNPTGRGSIAVSRNDRLIAQGPLGPTGSPAAVPTSGDFVYRTPYVEFVDPLVPLIESGTPIDVSQLGMGSNPRPLSVHLLNLLDAAASVIPGGVGNGQRLELLCGYGFEMASDGGDALVVTTPLRLVPSQVVGPWDAQRFAEGLAASLHRWYADAAIQPGNGMLVLDLAILTAAGSRLAARAPRASHANRHGDAHGDRPAIGDDPANGGGQVHGRLPRAGHRLPQATLETGVAIGACASPPKPILRLTQLQLPLVTIDWSKP